MQGYSPMRITVTRQWINSEGRMTDIDTEVSVTVPWDSDTTILVEAFGGIMHQLGYMLPAIREAMTDYAEIISQQMKLGAQE